MTTFPVLADALQRTGVRFVLIGTWGANLHARDATAVFTTFDFDLFLPPEPDPLVGTWRVCEELGLSLQVAGDVFVMDGVDVPVARLRHIIESKGATAREKDRLFLATHRAALREMLDDDTD